MILRSPEFAARSIDEIVARYEQASRKLREEIRQDPEKAKAFLISAGIAQKSDTDPTGIELVPDLRSGED